MALHDRVAARRMVLRTPAGATVALALLLAGALTAFAQERTPSGASLVGTWRLDPYLSDHPTQVALALRFNTGEANDSELFGGMAERGGGSGRRGGGGSGTAEPGRGAAPRGSSRQELSEADRKILTELTDAVRTPPTTLTISQEETGFTIATGAQAPNVLRTNGKAEKFQLTAGTIERTATREGPNLVVLYDAERAGTITYTFGLAPTTGQLLVRVSYVRREGEPGPFVIKLVYNPATPPAASQ